MSILIIFIIKDRQCKIIQSGHFNFGETGHYYFGLTLYMRIMYIMLNLQNIAIQRKINRIVKRTDAHFVHATRVVALSER